MLSREAYLTLAGPALRDQKPVALNGFWRFARSRPAGLGPDLL
jgi:hypothetical protein